MNKSQLLQKIITNRKKENIKIKKIDLSYRCIKLICTELEEIKSRITKIDTLTINNNNNANEQKNNNKYENKYIVYVINLEKRKDRLEHIINEFSRLKFIDLYRFDAYHNVDGKVGCAQSHIALMKYAYANQQPYIFVIEDDCILKSDISNDEYYEIFECLAKNYREYQMFNGNPYIFASHAKNMTKTLSTIKTISNNVFYYITRSGHGTNFVVYTRNMYGAVANKFNGGHIDVHMAQNIKQLIYYKYITSQLPSKSDIVNDDVNYTNMINHSEEIFKIMKSKDNENIFSP